MEILDGTNYLKDDPKMDVTCDMQKRGIRIYAKVISPSSLIKKYV